MKEISLTGKVAIKKKGVGSKSERNAVILQTSKGDYTLRKLGGNAYDDPSLIALEGKSITATGVVDQKLFLAKNIRETEE
jgi:hypothetical protein